MRKFTGNTIGIEQGETEVFTEFEGGGSMWTGEGNRERRKRISFAEPFRSKPMVQVHITLLDADTGPFVRAHVKAEAITKSGFDLVFQTWADSRVARIRMGWMAIGEAKNPDDWDV